MDLGILLNLLARLVNQETLKKMKILIMMKIVITRMMKMKIIVILVTAIVTLDQTWKKTTTLVRKRQKDAQN